MAISHGFEASVAGTPLEEARAAEEDATPLYVDLDGTLVATDLLWESLLAVVRAHPAHAVLAPLWLLKGRSDLKAFLADRVVVDAAHLPYRPELLAYLHEEKKRGRRLVLATATDERIARAIADHLGIFDGVIASSRGFNCKGEAKLRAVMADSHPHGFDYVGDSKADLPLWKTARQGMVVSSNRAVLRAAAGVCEPTRVFDPSTNRARAMLKALRPHQWVKNLLVVVPVILAHKLLDLAYVIPALVALAAFCVSASAVYLINDLLDIPADRQHHKKRHRPLAAGTLEIPVALFMTFILLLTAGALCLALPLTFSGLLLSYLILTTSYSLVLKRKLMVDVICLAGLYTVRILAGGQATTLPISPWMLAFSTFFFLSLAFVKRFVELDTHQEGVKVDRRGYYPSDIDMVRCLGTASGYLCILVVALYINSPEVQQLYHRPWLHWLICPVLLFWISRIWFLAHRHEMPHDPVVFALTDKQSYLAGFLVGLILLAAK